MPSLSSQSPVMGQALMDAILNALDTNPAAALLVTPKLRLYTAGPTPITRDSVVADFTEAGFDGYAEVAVVLSNPVTLPSGDGRGSLASGNFIMDGSADPQTVLGYYIVSDTNDFVLGEAFETPVPMSAPGDFIALDVFFFTSNTVQVP